MGKIEVRKFDNYFDFKNNKVTIKELEITMSDLLRHAISIGGSSQRGVSKKGRKFYNSLVEMALKLEGDDFRISDDYRYAEQSIKTSISFFMGMLAAKVIAEQCYDTPCLFHLKDEIIIYSSCGKNTPDFFGLSNLSEPVLVEAKGTVEKKPANIRILHAKKQIEAIKSVEIKGTAEKYSSFKGAVIASAFDADKLVYYDIDPVTDGDNRLVIDLNKAVVSYYSNLMFLLLSTPTDSYRFENRQYVMVNLHHYKIGLEKNIYNILKEYKELYEDNKTTQHDDIPNLYNSIYRVTSETISSRNNEISLGRDGIICMGLRERDDI